MPRSRPLCAHRAQAHSVGHKVEGYVRDGRNENAVRAVECLYDREARNTVFAKVTAKKVMPERSFPGRSSFAVKSPAWT